MKTLFIFISILICCIQSFSQKVHELTDRKDIVFARNLIDWQFQPVDSLMFDIYYPTGATSDKKYPVYFSLHGGSFQTATKQSVSEFSDEIADYGFVVVAPDYRTGYEEIVACTPENDSTQLQEAIYRAMQDANACIRYVTNHAKQFNVDTNWIFMGGASAGGVLALNCAYVNDSVAAVHYPHSVATWGKLQNSGNREPYNYTIKGLCPMWGNMPYWDSLINSRSAIPTILYKGGKDNNVPDGVGYYYNCRYASKLRAGAGIYDVLVALGVPAVYHYQNNAGHSAYDNLFCLETINCFFTALMKRKPYSGFFELYNTSCR